MKSKLSRNENVLGAFVGFYSPHLVEIIGYSNFDFVVIDDEHGAFSTSELENMIRTADSVGLFPIVRVSYDLSSIQKALDRGAKGIQVPMISTKEEAEEVVRRAKFPPDGERGVAYSHRAAGYGNKGGVSFLEKSNNEILISVHIETELAVKNFKEIMSVKGIDLAFLGTTDLSVSMGYPNQLENNEVQSAIKSFYEQAEEVKVKIGTVSSDLASTRKAYETGADYVVLVGSSFIMRELTNFVKDVK